MRLHNLINPLLSEQVTDNAVVITEYSNIGDNQKLQNISISQLPMPHVFVVSLDKKTGQNGQETKFYNNWLNNEQEYINKSCDGVIIHYDNNDIDLVFCELKSKNPTPSTYESQLVNTKLFFDYLLNLHNRFFEGNSQIRKCIFVLFYLNRNRTIQTEKSMRNKVGIIEKPTPKKEVMQFYQEYELIIYPCSKSMHEHINWADLVSNQFEKLNNNTIKTITL